MAKKKYVDEFYLTNIKKHQQLEGKVKGRHFAVTGPNGIGKTTVFQAIRRMLASLPDADKPDTWVTQGEDSGEIRVVLANNGDTYLSQERISSNPRVRSRVKAWKQTGDNKDELSSPQARLKELFGNTDDLTPLMDMSGKDQFKFLKTRLGIDPENYEAGRAALTKVRSDLKGKKNVLESILDKDISEADEKEYGEPKDVTKVLEKKMKMQPLREEKDRLEKEQAGFAEKRGRITEIDQLIKKLTEEKKVLQQDLGGEAKSKMNLIRAVEAVKRAEDVNIKVEEELKTVTAFNEKHHTVKEYMKRKAQIELLATSIKDYNEKVKVMDLEFYDLLATKPLNKAYPGLELLYKPKDEEQDETIGLYLDGLRFHTSQLSYGLMIKCLIKLSVYLNPTGLNFIYISSWDLLDTKNKEELLAFADAEDNVQLGIEKVDDRSEVAIEFIELK